MTDYKAVATALNAHLSEKYNTTIVTDGAWWVEVGKLLVDAVTVAVPWLRSIIDVLDDAHSTRSVTLPKPGGEGAIIVYSSAAIADGLSYCVTAVHEHEHARVLKAHPDIEVIVDYMSPELRAASEARAYACGAFARYLLTGNLQTADEMVSPLSHGYLLTRADLDFARGMLMSDLRSMARGAVPPHEVCQVVLAFLRTQFPAAIVPPEFRAQ